MVRILKGVFFAVILAAFGVPIYAQPRVHAPCTLHCRPMMLG